jgi:ElaB/YqjD/DUF883 family membrane-anchored ribosome-binding protein
MAEEEQFSEDKGFQKDISQQLAGIRETLHEIEQQMIDTKKDEFTVCRDFQHDVEHLLDDIKELLQSLNQQLASAGEKKDSECEELQKNTKQQLKDLKEFQQDANKQLADIKKLQQGMNKQLAETNDSVTKSAHRSWGAVLITLAFFIFSYTASILKPEPKELTMLFIGAFAIGIAGLLQLSTRVQKSTLISTVYSALLVFGGLSMIDFVIRAIQRAI